jgi:Ni/Fe-hydrogenase subunit HybB-like protein
MKPGAPMGKKRSPWAFLLTGWVAVVAAVLLVGLSWPAVFPSGQKLAEFYGSDLGYPLVILSAIIIGTPVALVGGLIGSRIPREGGRREQHLAAALIAILMALPFSCLVLWYFTP